MAAKSKSNVIKISRVYDAPLKMVWDAWVDPKQVAQWWGPRGFTLTTESKDVRAGGHWKYVMHGPDGVDYPNHTIYHEVEEYSRMIYDHGGNEHQPPLFRVTAIFTESNGKTKLEMSMALSTPEAAEQTRKFIKKANGDSTWDRLAEFLAKNQTGKDKFVINRSFDVSVNRLFDAWARPDQLVRWVPPTGFEMAIMKGEIKPAGSTLYRMQSADGANQMYGKTQYIELTHPNRIVYTQQFCDKDERISRHPHAPTWPETMLTVVTFYPEGEDQSRVMVEWEPYGAVTAEELSTFLKSRDGMMQGWTGSFDKLEELFAES